MRLVWKGLQRWLRRMPTRTISPETMNELMKRDGDWSGYVWDRNGNYWKEKEYL